jgi:hypothetical protein
MRRRSLLLLPLAAVVLGAGCISTRGPAALLDAEAPEFTLASHEGKDVSLGNLLQTGPAVLVFYRGYW